MDHLPQRTVHLPVGAITENVQAVGYNDLQGRPGFKMSIRHTQSRWYLYLGHFWHSGWTVVDVTDPAASEVVAFIPGPENTSTFQMELSGDLMITALERPLPGFGKNPHAPFDEGVLIWDIGDPIHPKKLGQFRTGGTGTHRNFYAGGRYMHLAAGMHGFEGNIYVIVDISDPTHPVEAGRWWIPGQHTEGGEKAAKPNISLHGPPYVMGTLAYLPYGPAGMVILDISEGSAPRFISQLEFCPFTSQFAAHSVLPFPDKGIAFVTSEDTSYGKGPLSHASIVDISDPSQPFLMATLPVPHPPPRATYRDFTEKGGWSARTTAITSSIIPTCSHKATCFTWPTSMLVCASITWLIHVFLWKWASFCHQTQDDAMVLCPRGAW